MSTVVKFTYAQYEEMTRLGLFNPPEDHRVELLYGEIVPKYGDDPRTPMDPPHAQAVIELTEWSFEALPRALARVSIQCSIGIPALDSVPDPDLAWLARKDYSNQLPAPDDIFLIVEVADSSLAKDRGEKAGLYAEAGIRDYWIVNIRSRLIEVRRDPRGKVYQSIESYLPGQEVRPLAFPDVSLPVSRLFPD